MKCNRPPGRGSLQADDRDKSDKFRIFGILIDVHSLTPKIPFRGGVYDFFKQISAGSVGAMLMEFVDLNEVDRVIEKFFG